MAPEVDPVEAAYAARILAEAEQIMRSERYCWLGTAADKGGVRLRPMGKVAFKDWNVHFLSDGRSEKVSDLRVSDKASIMCQREADDSYVAMSGTATLREDQEEVRRRWREAYDQFFPNAADKAHAVFVEIKVDCIELWLRGRTPEPFGSHTTTLRRDAETWRLVT